MLVNRMELLEILQSVFPGVSQKDSIEQGSYFAFKGKSVWTFNGEICCKRRLPKGLVLHGAVPAKPLISLLSKMVEDQVTVEVKDSVFNLIGKKRRRNAGIRMDMEVTLPVDQAERAGDEWTPLHEDFLEAVRVVQDCAGEDESKFALTCIHIHPKWIEACDAMQMTRFRLPTGFSEKFIIKKKALKYVASFDMTEFNETDSWVHFKSPSGLIMSCRRYMEEYPNLSPVVKFPLELTEITLPNGMEDVANKAAIFSSENKDENRLLVSIKSGIIKIDGVGNSGWYSESRKCRYAGPDVVFTVSPAMLIEIVKRNTECVIAEGKLKIKNDKWVFVAYLGHVNKEGEFNAEESD